MYIDRQTHTHTYLCACVRKGTKKERMRTDRRRESKGSRGNKAAEDGP